MYRIYILTSASLISTEAGSLWNIVSTLRAVFSHSSEFNAPWMIMVPLRKMAAVQRLISMPVFFGSFVISIT